MKIYEKTEERGGGHTQIGGKDRYWSTPTNRYRKLENLGSKHLLHKLEIAI